MVEFPPVSPVMLLPLVFSILAVLFRFHRGHFLNFHFHRLHLLLLRLHLQFQFDFLRFVSTFSFSLSSASGVFTCFCFSLVFSAFSCFCSFVLCILHLHLLLGHMFLLDDQLQLSCPRLLLQMHHLLLHLPLRGQHPHRHLLLGMLIQLLMLNLEESTMFRHSCPVFQSRCLLVATISTLSIPLIKWNDTPSLGPGLTIPTS